LSLYQVALTGLLSVHPLEEGGLLRAHNWVEVDPSSVHTKAEEDLWNKPNREEGDL